MTLSDLSIKRPVFAWMLMSGLIVFGAISAGRLGVSQMPDVDFPVLNMQVDWSGAAPEVIEAEIVDRLEQAVMSVQGIKEITSTIRQGQATVVLEFDLDRNLDAALQEVQSAISRIRLPNDVDPPQIMKINPDDQPILWLGVSSQRSLRDLIVYIDSNLRDQFQILPGVGEVILGGFSERNLRLWVDNRKMQEYELTILDLKKAIEMEHVEMAAGIIENDNKVLNVRMMGEGMTAAQVGEILILQRGGRPIYKPGIRIRDVARVEDGLDDIRRISHINGIGGVGLGIKKQRGANSVEVADRVKRKMDEIQKTLPKDIQIGVNFDATLFISESVHETEYALVLSALCTGLVCWMFFGSWSSTFNVLLSIPTSVIGTFTILYFLNFTMNMFTLLGLALAVGIVVDDAIMVLENIVRHQELGKDRVTAARDGAREITFAAVASSVAVVAIFLPIVFVKGIIGKFLYQFGVTISAAVMLSLLEAITLTPMRCSQFVSSHRQHGAWAAFADRQFQSLASTYREILRRCLNHRILVLCLSLAVFMLSLIPARHLRGEMVPAQDQSMFLMRCETPVGSSIHFTERKVSEIETYLKSRPETKKLFAAIGGFTGGEPHVAYVFVVLKPRRERDLSQEGVMAQCREALAKMKDVKVFIQDFSMRGFSAQRGFPIEFNIRGGNWEVLAEKSTEIVRRLKETGLATDIDTDYRTGVPELQVWPDRVAAAERGVSVDTIAQTVNAAIGGARQGKFSQDGRRYDVRLRLNPNERLEPEDIETLTLRNNYGEMIPIRDVVKVERQPALMSITRRNRERSVSVFANVATGQSQASALGAAQKIGKEVLPEGYKLHLSGSAETFKESALSLLFMLVMGILISYMVLASQFNSFLHPVTVLLALPFSISGAFVALFVWHQSINLYSVIGIILLMGIVKKNSILLVEFTNKKRYEEGMPLREAILEAGPIRLRPILMTSLATIAAAIPPALAFGPGAETRVPMSITIIGGMIVSTLFTLLVVPCAYSLLAKLERNKEHEVR